MRVYTDGACSGNPGPGGWAWATTDGQTRAGGEPHTTNQRMELQAVLEAVKALDGPIDIYSDSTYVVNCFNDQWYKGWLKRGWKNSQKKPVANRDIWEPLIDIYLQDPDRLRFFWVKGHSGDKMNDLVDALAVAEVDKIKETSKVDAFADVEAPWPVDRAVGVIGSPGDDLETARIVLDSLNSDSVVISGLRRGMELELAERAVASGYDLGVVLPFADPVGRWDEKSKNRFDTVLSQAAWVVTLAGDKGEPQAALRDRNSWLKSCVIAVVTSDQTVADSYDAAGVSVLGV